MMDMMVIVMVMVIGFIMRLVIRHSPSPNILFSRESELDASFGEGQDLRWSIISYLMNTLLVTTE